MRRIEVLYFDSCPGWRAAVQRVRQALADSGNEDSAAIHLIAVETEEQAQRLRFLGSPTVRVDGRDVDPRSEENSNFGLQCRLYEHDRRIERVPPSDLIVAALRLRTDMERTDRHHVGGRQCL